MAGSFTDAVVATMEAYFETGDTPTAAQFTALIEAIQAGIETHTHTGAGDGEAGNIGADSITNRTRTFFVPAVVGYNNTDSADIYATQDAGVVAWVTKDCTIFGGFHVPEDFASGMSVKACIIPYDTGNVYSKNTSSYQAHGEAMNTHTSNGTYGTTAITSGYYYEINSLSLSSVAKNDFVRLQWRRDGTHASDTVGGSIMVYGWLVSYTADS